MSVSQGSKILASDVSSSADASTIVLRTSSGDIYGKFGHFTNIWCDGHQAIDSLVCKSTYGASGTSVTGAKIRLTPQNTNVEGTATLTLGTDTTSATLNNMSGVVTLYNSNGGSSSIEGKYSSILGGNKDYLKMQYVAMNGGLCIMDSDSVEIGSLYSTTKGTTSAFGVCRLILGNAKNTASTKVNNNSSGSILLYTYYGSARYIEPSIASGVISDGALYYSSSSTNCDIYTSTFMANRIFFLDASSGPNGDAGVCLGGIVSNVGATTDEGWTSLILGNNKNSTTAKNTSGRLYLYDSNGSNCRLSGKYDSDYGSYIECNRRFQSAIHPLANVGSGATTHSGALQTYWNSYKSNIPRASFNTYYSAASNNGSCYMGYFIPGYDSSPYGGFFVAHYGNAYYVGISGGTFTQYLLQGINQSSRQVKYNIKELDKPSNIIDQLKPVSFIYKNDPDVKTHLGLIYEDTIDLLPEICIDDGMQKYIRYDELTPLLIKEIQQLRKRVNQLELICCKTN